MDQVVSGGQTGVDRAALDAAIHIGIAHGGWCPKGRRAEDGRIADVYLLRETESRNYAVRTEQNVIDSDATLVLYRQILSGGTELTVKFANRHRRRCHMVDLGGFEQWDQDQLEHSIESAKNWIVDNGIRVLNVAGPRESTSRGIGKAAEAFLVRLFEACTD